MAVAKPTAPAGSTISPTRQWLNLVAFRMASSPRAQWWDGGDSGPSVGDGLDWTFILRLAQGFAAAGYSTFKITTRAMAKLPMAAPN